MKINLSKKKKNTPALSLEQKHPRLSKAEVREAFEKKPEPAVEEIELLPEEQEGLEEFTENEKEVLHKVGVDAKDEDSLMQQMRGYNNYVKKRKKIQERATTIKNRKNVQRSNKDEIVRDLLINAILDAVEEAVPILMDVPMAKKESVKFNISTVITRLNKLSRVGSKAARANVEERLANLKNIHVE